MTFDALNRQLRNARMQRNIVVLLVLFMFVMNAMLVSTLSRTTRTTVLLPSRIADGMVAAGAIDHRFVEAIGLDAVYAIYNTSPETSAAGRAVVERISSVRDRADLLRQYDDIANDAKERRISTRFERQMIDFDPRTLTMRVMGRLTTYVETEVVAISERTVVLTFIEEAASVRLSAMRIEEADA